MKVSSIEGKLHVVAAMDASKKTVPHMSLFALSATVNPVICTGGSLSAFAVLTVLQSLLVMSESLRLLSDLTGCQIKR